MFLNKPLYSISFNKFSMSLLILMAALLSGCGAGGGAADSKTGALTPASIAITPATATVAKGQTTNFTATATYTNGPPVDITSKVTWLSSNPSVATIDSTTGVATGVTPGSATTNVTASFSGITSPAATLSITTAVITGVTISPVTASTPKGVPVTFIATATYSDGSSGIVSGLVTWTSSKPAIATLNGSGIVSSLAQGTTTITATANSVTSNPATLIVTAPGLTAIAVSPSTVSVAKSLTTHFTATGTYTDASTADITSKVNWLSSSPSVATIDSATGVATGVTPGSATTNVTASLSGITSPAATLSVTAAAITTISISPVTSSTPNGVSVPYAATAVYSDNSSGIVSGSVTWHSSSPAVATLNGNGTASSLAQGTTTITASTIVGINTVTSNSATLSVTAPVLATLAITPSPASIAVLGTKQFTASGILTDGTTATLGTLTWTSSNIAVAAISSTGVAKGVSAGSSNISAGSGSIISNIVAMTVNPGSLIGGVIQGTPLNLTAAVSTFAGSGTRGAIDATGTLASFSDPIGICTDGSNLFVADTSNNKIRKIVIATGVVTTIAGSGSIGAVDANGTTASFSSPVSCTTDGINLYVADAMNQKIRKIVIASGLVSTVAGTGTAGSVDATGTAASFNIPSAITSDDTNLYVADRTNNKIRQIVIISGAVTTLAGSGTAGAVDATGTAASFNYPQGITTDGTNLYVADAYNNKIRKIAIAGGVVTTLAGSGAVGAVDATGTAASFNGPTGIVTDGSNLYVTDRGNYKIRKIVIDTGVVTTVAGSGALGAVDATGTAASFFNLFGITTDGSNLYMGDVGNQNIRKIQ